MKEALASRPQDRQDRRLKVRHRAPDLQVTLSPTGWLRRFRQPVKVRCVDINRYGMALETDQKLRKNERVWLAFKGRYIAESDIEGVVVSTQTCNGHYRYGIAFAYCTYSKLYSREVDNALSRIESLCSQSELDNSIS